MTFTTFTKTIGGIEYSAKVILHDSGKKSVSFSHYTGKGIRAVAFTATTMLDKLNSEFATEIKSVA